MQFQAVRAVESDTRKMLHAINVSLGPQALSAEQIDRSFRKWWPELEKALSAMPRAMTGKVDLRSDREILEEILGRVRLSGKSSGGRRPSYLEDLSMFVDDPFEGREVEAFAAALIDKLGLNGDPNEEKWFEDGELNANILNGTWFSRWSGGTAGDGWVNGQGHLAVLGEHVYIVTHDTRSDCLIVTRRKGTDGLVGLYVNLGGTRIFGSPLKSSHGWGV